MYGRLIVKEHEKHKQKLLLSNIYRQYIIGFIPGSKIVSRGNEHVAQRLTRLRSMTAKCAPSVSVEYGTEAKCEITSVGVMTTLVSCIPAHKDTPRVEY